MSLHGLRRVTMGVPDLESTAQFYEDFGLDRRANYAFGTTDGGEQLRLIHSSARRLVEAEFAVDDRDDLQRTADSLRRLGMKHSTSSSSLVAADPGTSVAIALRVHPRIVQDPTPAPVYNGPGRFDRVNARAPGLLVKEGVKPRRLGHLVLGTTDYEASYAFFTKGLGFKVSDMVRDVGVFLRCSTDHHNILIQRAPVPFLHHTSWQVDDIDAIGRGAMAMLAEHPERHVWGLGRHYAGSNFFWYFKDPAGNFAEYHSDMDCIPEDEIWDPEVLEGARGLYLWGPPPPPSFINPDDLAGLMAGAHDK